MESTNPARTQPPRAKAAFPPNSINAHQHTNCIGRSGVAVSLAYNHHASCGGGTMRQVC